jgi:hypothetical protein
LNSEKLLQLKGKIMSEYFMRPVQILTINANQRAHCQLFNPAESGYKVIVDKIWVSRSSGFTLIGHGGPMFNDATFPESRGLPIADGAPRQYSSAHARFTKTTFPAEVVQGCQYFNHENVSGLVLIEAPFVLGENNALTVRNNLDGEKLMVSFLWHEEPLGS